MATGTKAYLCFIFTTAASVKQKARALSFLLLIQLQDEVPLPCFFPLYIFISLSLTSLILVFFCVISSPCILLHFMSSFLTKAILFFFSPLPSFQSPLKGPPRVTSANIQLLPLTPISALQQLYLFPFSTSVFRFPVSKFLLPTSTDHLLSLIFRNSPTSFQNNEILERKILKAES